jgi:hypothetical protein
MSVKIARLRSAPIPRSTQDAFGGRLIEHLAVEGASRDATGSRASRSDVAGGVTTAGAVPTRSVEAQ